MLKLRNMKIRTQLLLTGGIAISGLIIFGLMAFYTMNKIKVNGPIYKNIVQGKDLIADILPPPEYILESYLTVLQSADETDPGKQKNLIEKFKQLRKDFDDRHVFWQKDLPDSPMKETLLKKSYLPAIAFYEKADKEFFPAVLANDRNRARTVMVDLNRNYEVHRQAIDELVKLANDRNAAYEAFAVKTINRETILLVIIMFMTIAATAVAATLITRIILRQIGGEPNYIAGMAEKVSAGDLSVRFEHSKEMSGIYASMASMLEGLKGLVQGIQSNSGTIASASHELSASAEQMSRGVTEQSGRASQIATSSAEMSQTVIDIAQNASGIATAANETNQLARDGKQIVDQSVTESEMIAAVVYESSEKIGNLGEQSKQIGEIVNVIKDIADQTNLLALNAAIEAARAGEQGRGFAVVADEVRKLAERTSKATSEIATMIDSIQKEIVVAVGSMGEATDKVKRGVELSNKAGTSLDKIVQSIEDLQGKVQHIASATEEMSTTSESISMDIENVAKVSEETSASSDQISRSSSDLAKLASDLQNLVAQFRV